MGKMSTVILKESRRGFSSVCEIDEQGLEWLVVMLRGEADVFRTKKEDWTIHTKIGNIWLTRDANQRGEFLKLSWTVGKSKFPRLLIISNDGKGWRALAAAIEECIGGSVQRCRGDTNKKPKAVHKDLRSDINLKRFGAWNLALVVETNSKSVSLHRIGEGIVWRFRLSKGFKLYPFQDDKAFFFTSSMEHLKNFCDNGIWEEENIHIVIQRWVPEVNAIKPLNELKWVSINGLPFHCWEKESVLNVLKGLGTVEEIDTNCLNFIDLSSIKVRVKNLIPNLPLEVRFANKGVDLLVRVEELKASEEMRESAFVKIVINGGRKISEDGEISEKDSTVGLEEIEDRSVDNKSKNNTHPHAWTEVKRSGKASPTRMNPFVGGDPMSSGSRFEALTDRSVGIQTEVEETAQTRGRDVEEEEEQPQVFSPNDFKPKPNWLILKRPDGSTSKHSLKEVEPSPVSGGSKNKGPRSGKNL